MKTTDRSRKKISRKSSRATLAKPCPQEYDFALILDGITDLSDQVMERLFEAGCDDATFSMRYGRVIADFSREAATCQEAVLSAIRNIREAGVGANVLRVNNCDLVTPADIARRIDRSRELISKYISGERGPGDFPPPECFLAEDKPLWLWCQVSHWLVENHLIKPGTYHEAQLILAINDWLAAERAHREIPDLLAEIEKTLTGKAQGR